MLDARRMPKMDSYKSWLATIDVEMVALPHDCTDGFLCVYWRRPFAYLNPDVRSAISSFWAIGDVSEALTRLKADLESGVWSERHAHLEVLETCDLGYRLVVAH